MDDPDPAAHRARAPYATTVLIALGWYATAAAAFLVALATMAEDPQQGCSAGFNCLSMPAAAVLMVIVIAPFAACALIVTLLAAVPMARLVPSAVVAGTLTAAISVGTVGFAALAYGSLR